MKLRQLLILFLILPFTGLAQGNFASENGLFEVDYLKGCVGTTITVTPTDPTGTYVPCFDADLTDVISTENQQCFNEQANDPNTLEFTYTETGVYDILVIRQIGNAQQFDSITIEIIDPELPAFAFANCGGDIVFDLDPNQESFDIYTLDFGDGSPSQDFNITEFPVSHTYPDNSISYTFTASGSFDNSGFNNCANTLFSDSFIPDNLLERPADISALRMTDTNNFEINFEANSNQIYRVELSTNSNNSFQEIGTILNESNGTFNVPNVDLTSNFYCIRIITESICDGSDLISNEVCTIQLEGEAQTDGNLITWNSGNFSSNDIVRNGTEIFNGQSPFLDANVLCGETETYIVRSTNADGIEIQSLPIELLSIATGAQTAISQIASRYLSANELEISWENPQGIAPDNFIVYKKRNINDDFFELDSTTTNSYIDESTNFGASIFYYSVGYLNNCGTISELVSTAPNILLNANQSESIINFTWNNYTGYGDSLSHYVVKKYDADRNLIQEIDNGLNISYEDNVAGADQQLFIHQVEAVSESGLISYSNEVEYKISPIFFVPSGFSPNGDGRNEELKVVGKFINEVELSIFNRWGTLIFQSNNIEIGWDGYLKDREAPAGAYTYTILVKDRFGEEFFKSGIVNLIR